MNTTLAVGLMGLCFALGIIIGVKIDRNIVIHGKVKQRGKGNVQDVTSNLDLKQTKTERKEARKQKRLLKKSK